MLAVCAVVQESAGFTPNDLVLGHKVCTPLSVLSGDLDGNTRELSGVCGRFLLQAVSGMEKI